MDKPLYTFKPNLMNSLFPEFLKQLLFSLFIVGGLYGLLRLLTSLNIYTLPKQNLWLFILGTIMVLSSLFFKIITLINTSYFFYHNHVTREFKFLIVRKHSIPYNQITNLTLDVSVWDRICKAGDLTLHTAEDKEPNLILKYVNNPEKVENLIHGIIEKKPKSKNKQI